MTVARKPPSVGSRGDVAAMRAGDGARRRQPQADAPGAFVTRTLDAEEGLNTFSISLSGMPGPSSSTVTCRFLLVDRGANIGAPAIAHRIVDEIGESRFSASGRPWNTSRPSNANSARWPESTASSQIVARSAARSTGWEASVVASSRAKQELDSTICAISSRSAKNLALRLGVDRHLLDAQAHPGDRATQIVGDRGQHPQTVVDEATDARLHLIERARGDRTSSGPSSASGGALTSNPSRSAAWAKAESGAVIHPLAHHENTTIAAAITSVETIEPSDNAPPPTLHFPSEEIAVLAR